MGVKQSSNVAQEVFETMFRDLPEMDVYIDDVGCFDDSWQSHLNSIHKVLKCLQDNGFTVNPTKCKWAGNRLFRLLANTTRVMTMEKKSASHRGHATTYKCFTIAIIHRHDPYYRDMWPGCSDFLAPFTELTGKTKEFKWNDQLQAAFEKVKAIIISNAMLQYPDHTKSFQIEMDASDYQLGAVIKQDGKPVVYYSRKLNAAQHNYTMIEKELLSVIETLKEFRSMLLGAEIDVYSDHQNLTHALMQFATQ